MSAIYSRGVARIRHATTGEIFEIPAEDLDWAEFASDERQMGLEIGYSATIEHPALGLLTWELWEYPIGAENMKETDVNGHELLENISFGLQNLPDDEEPEAEPPLALRLAALPRQLDELDRLLVALRDRAPMIGHNRPPDEFRLAVDAAQIDAARESIADIRSELAKPDPAGTADPETLDRAESRFRQLAEKIASWIKSGAILVGKGAVTGVGAAIAKEMFTSNAALHDLLVTVADTLSSWIQVIGIS
jgi:hypothetical protein